MLTKKVAAFFVFESYCTQNVFDSDIKEVLVTELKPGKTIILDNAIVQKSKALKEIIENTSCSLFIFTAL